VAAIENLRNFNPLRKALYISYQLLHKNGTKQPAGALTAGGPYAIINSSGRPYRPGNGLGLLGRSEAFSFVRSFHSILGAKQKSKKRPAIRSICISKHIRRRGN
jgi:hypothetical protein